MGRMETFQPAPAAAISRVLATFDRDQLAGFIEVAIGLLDVADGDPDLEEDDDPGQSTEDEISYGNPGFGARGPGCAISDPDVARDDFGIDALTEDGI
jgi:hypothetical protein